MQSSSVENINFFGVVVIFLNLSLWLVSRLFGGLNLLKTFWKYEVLKILILDRRLRRRSHDSTPDIA